jgi:cytochrome P450
MAAQSAEQQLSMDPLQAFEDLRETDPVHASKEWGGWILSRYEDVAPGLRDPRLSLQGGVSAMFEQLSPALRSDLKALERHVSLWLGALDPANHRRLRSILVSGFTPEVVERTRTLTSVTADRLLADLAGKGCADLLTEFAHPLPATVIASMLGAPYP